MAITTARLLFDVFSLERKHSAEANTGNKFHVQANQSCCNFSLRCVVGRQEQGSCAGLEFKVSLEKSLNFIKLKMSLNCFGKRVEDLEKFGICLCETFNKTW